MSACTSRRRTSERRQAPSSQAFGFFNQNLVMEYTHEQAVADQVNVDFDVYRISTKITEQGSTIDPGLVTAFRDRQTRRLRWETLDEDVAYGSQALDRAVVAKDQIRTVVRAFKERLFSEIFPGGTEVPKTLTSPRTTRTPTTSSRSCRDEFGKGDDFAVKITYRSTGRKPDEMTAEGNYLLLDQPPWCEVRELLDRVWYLDVPADVLRRRLIDRQMAYGRQKKTLSVTSTRATSGTPSSWPGPTARRPDYPNLNRAPLRSSDRRRIETDRTLL